MHVCITEQPAIYWQHETKHTFVTTWCSWRRSCSVPQIVQQTKWVWKLQFNTTKTHRRRQSVKVAGKAKGSGSPQQGLRLIFWTVRPPLVGVRGRSSTSWTLNYISKLCCQKLAHWHVSHFEMLRTPFELLMTVDEDSAYCSLPLLPGAVLALARWEANGGHSSSWGGGAQYAAELRILLVYLSESLGRLGQNGEPLRGHIFHGGPRPPWPSVEPSLPPPIAFRTLPIYDSREWWGSCPRLSPVATLR